MATLALSTIGTALGGPIGGAIGSLVGNSIDQGLFGPGPRRGPRLNDLSVQTSSYGTQIPRIYGSMRIAGSVIWATELKESSEPQSGAKGQPEAVVYSYSASFAVALSSRLAKGVGRIWADGKLLRGSEGDFKVKTKFRFHPGSEDQAPDPLIASIEGIERAPAFRGLAVAVFENLQLAEYGNRIPFLTFEILADEAAPTVGSIAADASNGIIVGEAADVVHGYAAYGTSRRSAVQPLVDHFALSLFDDGERLRQSSTYFSVVPANEEGCSADEGRAQARERAQAVSRMLPRSLALRYYDPARDYQTGQMRAIAGGTLGVDEARELPVAIGADQAKALAESHIARRWAERDKLLLRLPPTWLPVEPGSIIKVDDGLWCAEQVTLEDLVVRVDLSPVSEMIESALADPGTHLPAPDVIAAPTVLAVLDLPDLGIGRHDVPVLQVAACQPVAGWRLVPLEVAIGGVVSTIVSAPGEAVIGTVLNALADGPSTELDEVNFIEIELADGEHWLESRNEEALATGANLASVGRELIQFGGAIPIGERRFRLEGLLRARFGTEWATASHGPNEAFVLIQPGALKEIPLSPSAVGTSISIRPLGLADDDSQPIEAVVGGEAMRPPSPVDLRAEVQTDGALSLVWTRRSRLGWNRPVTDAPLGESVERYRVTVQGSGVTLTLEAREPQLLISAVSMNGVVGAVTITVVQVGDFAESRPIATSIAI